MLDLIRKGPSKCISWVNITLSRKRRSKEPINVNATSQHSNPKLVWQAGPAAWPNAKVKLTVEW